jgi:hypothetical protein
VFAVKERLSAETLADLRPFDRFRDAEVRDYMMVWIDSFGSNTTQGGFETLCAQEAVLRQLKALRAHIQEVNFCSDAGSGVQINSDDSRPSRHKENNTDMCEEAAFHGHNTDIKSRVNLS